ncbi:hypothetical protein Tco_1383396 [Tanacetum coccineum]
MNSDIEDDIMDPVMQCTTLPSHSSFSQQKLVSFVTEIHTTSIDFLTPIFILINGEPWLYGGGGIPFQLKSDSLPHAHAQTTKTYYKHQDSRINKAQDSKTKTSANSDIQDLPSIYQVYQGSLLASFLDDAKNEHVGQDTRSQGSTISDVLSSSLNDCRFRNDHIAKIMGYGNYEMDNVTISRVYYVEGLGHNVFYVGQFCDFDLEALLFLWVEAVATACYTQNQSLIRKRHNKTLYELLHDQKSNLSYLHVFGALCYPTNDGKDLAMTSKHFSSGLRPKLLTPGTINSGLVPNIPSLTLYVPPTKNDWEILFQPMFDERVWGVLLPRSITQDVYRTTKKSFKTDTLDLTNV